jgi:hypothetical protein
MIQTKLSYREVWIADFEFHGKPGDRPTPVCLVARELKSGRLVRLWSDQLRGRAVPPYSVDDDVLFVAFYAVAEMNCHLALGWPVAKNTLDLFTEFRVATNGTAASASLLSAMTHYQLSVMMQAHKDRMRQLILGGGPWDQKQQSAILDYCQEDVDATTQLLIAMLPAIDLPRALIRGAYMCTVAKMEHTGIPTDVELLQRLQVNWDKIKEQCIQEVDRSYKVYEGRTFKIARWASWLATHDIPWPRLPSGALATSTDTFKDMAKSFPAVAEMKQLRDLLGKTRTLTMPVGSDGRNRSSLSAFRTVTGRNQPGSSAFVFSLPSWLRGLIKPAEGRAIAYIDWSQQEFGIGAVLSNDGNMISAYESGDPYLRFGQQCGGIPADATKETHGSARERYKACVLGVQYRMGSFALANRIGKPPAYGDELLRLHRRTFNQYWIWNEQLVDRAILGGKLWTSFGWPLHVTTKTKVNTVANFPSQANGAEMLRIACMLITNAGIRICAPVHDAILIEADIPDIENAVNAAQRLMADASEIVLNGFRLRSDAKIIRFPDHFSDASTNDMLTRALRIVDQIGTAPHRVKARGSVGARGPGTNKFANFSLRRGQS